MTVKQLINSLTNFPSNLEVGFIYDGGDRADILELFISKGGKLLMTGDRDTPIYNTEDRPLSAPTEEEVKYYSLRD